MSTDPTPDQLPPDIRAKMTVVKLPGKCVRFVDGYGGCTDIGIFAALREVTLDVEGHAVTLPYELLQWITEHREEQNG